MSQRLLVGIDPGVTTGVCLAHELKGAIQAIDAKQIIRLDVLISWLDSLPTLAACIVEDYIGAGHRTTHAVHTIQTIGAIRGWAVRRGQTITMQPPQWRKAFVESARKMLSVRHGGRHKADALAHILAHEFRRRKDDRAQH